MEKAKEMFRDLSEPHRRAIRATLIRLDRACTLFEQLAGGFEIRSELYELRNTLSSETREKLGGEVSELKRTLTELRGRFGFERKTDDATHLIQTLCSFQWEGLSELKSPHLRQYGALPPEFGEILDRSMETLIERIGRISELMRHADVPGE
jgi:hypothetical protein